MKTLNLGDLHFGVKQDDPWIQNIQRDAIQQAVEYSIANGIKRWIQYGDWFDVRKAITHKTMEFTREMITLIEGAGIHVDMIVGNHDAHFKNTLTPNAASELLGQYSCITVYDKPTTVDYDGVLIDLIPWMCEENTAEIMNHIKTSSAEYCVGHWELNGFYFYKGMKSHGLEPDFLKKYKQVWAGHFHTISEAGNVKYIGTPYTITAGDENDARGFWEFNTDTHEMTFIPNRTTWHRKIFYPCNINTDDFKNLSVRVVVEKVDKNLTAFEAALEQVVHELKLISKVDNSVGSDGEEEIEVKSIVDLMDEYIDALPECNDNDSVALKQYVRQLYIETTTK